MSSRSFITDRVQYTMYLGCLACDTCGAPANEPCANLKAITSYVPTLSTRQGASFVRQLPHKGRQRSRSS